MICEHYYLEIECIKESGQEHNSCVHTDNSWERTTAPKTARCIHTDKERQGGTLVDALTPMGDRGRGGGGGGERVAAYS